MLGETDPRTRSDSAGAVGDDEATFSLLVTREMRRERSRMTIPLKLTDRDHLLSPGLADHIRERAQKLEHFFRGVQECRVTVDGPGQHPRRGRVRIRVRLSVPGSEILINRQTGEDLPMAIRESFDAADQRLEDYVRRSRRSSTTLKRRLQRSPTP